MICNLFHAWKRESKTMVRRFGFSQKPLPPDGHLLLVSSYVLPPLCLSPTLLQIGSESLPRFRYWFSYCTFLLVVPASKYGYIRKRGLWLNTWIWRIWQRKMEFRCNAMSLWYFICQFLAVGSTTWNYCLFILSPYPLYSLNLGILEDYMPHEIVDGFTAERVNLMHPSKCRDASPEMLLSHLIWN